MVMMLCLLEVSNPIKTLQGRRKRNVPLCSSGIDWKKVFYCFDAIVESSSPCALNCGVCFDVLGTRVTSAHIMAFRRDPSSIKAVVVC
jgi:hypothetical protein